MNLLVLGGLGLFVYFLYQQYQSSTDPGINDIIDVKASRAYRNNNPGNLIYNGQELAVGKDDKGYAQFANEADGWQALYNQIELDKSRNISLEKFIYKYAPPQNNNTKAYIDKVLKGTGLMQKDLLSNFDTQQLADTIARIEGWYKVA